MSHHGAPAGDADITLLLRRVEAGDRAAFDEMIQRVHEELRLIARRQLRRNRQVSLHTTDLLNEAFLRLVQAEAPQWKDRSHFFAVASIAMRRILVDRARRKLAQKRRADRDAVPLDDVGPVAVDDSVDPTELLALDEALERLRRSDEHLVRVVECKYFGGLTFDEMAVVFGRHERTLRADWRRARAWLHRELAS